MQRVRSYVIYSFCTLLLKNYARPVLSYAYFDFFFFELLDLEILINNTHNTFYFRLLDPEILTNTTQNIF